MSRVNENRVARLKQALGLAGADLVEDDGRDPVQDRAALRALLATRLGEDGADAQLAEMDARPPLGIRLSEASRHQIRLLLAGVPSPRFGSSPSSRDELS